MDNKNQSSINLPSAIIIAGAIIAISIIYVKKPVANTVPTNDIEQVSNKINLEPVTAKDHILGNPNAPIKIVEYSDPSCPYCKTFNSTMNQIMEKYGPSGKVAWVYRSIPLDTPDANGNVLHPNARNESQAIECAGILGGNEKFWGLSKNPIRNNSFSYKPNTSGSRSKTTTCLCKKRRFGCCSIQRMFE